MVTQDTLLKVEALKLEKEKLAQQKENSKQLVKIAHDIAPRIENYFNKKLELLESPKFKWSLILLTAIITVVVIGTGILVYFDKVNSESFTFLMGIVVGAAVALVGDILLQAQQ